MRLSIVMPVLNEAQRIVPALRAVAALAPDAERIVVDGGSTDGTAELATPHARVLHAERGRAAQLNQGAREATGDWLLFLHVDTALPPGFAGALEEVAQAGGKAGAFKLRIAGRHWLLPLLAWGATCRTRFRRLALGDQALFCGRGTFEAVGGYPPWPVMEDYGFTLALRDQGVRLHLAPLAVTTSGRRWDEAGFFRTWWQFRRFYWRFGHGRDLEAMAAEYPVVR